MPTGLTLHLGLALALCALAAALAWLGYRLGQAHAQQRRQGAAAEASEAALRSVTEELTRLSAAADTEHRLRDALRQADALKTAAETALAATERQLETLPQALMQALPLPVLLASRQASDDADATRVAPPWMLVQLNAAAQALLPSARPGQALAELLAPWPEAVASLSQPLPGSAHEQPADAAHAEVWRLTPLGTDTGHGARLLVCSAWPATADQATTPAASPAAAGHAEATGQTSQAGESEQFSFTLSHDLRAPIRVVEGFTRIVKEDYGRLLDRVGNDHLDRVLGAAARMNLMIDALLTLARLSSQPLARQPVNLTQLAHYVVDDLKRQQPERSAEVLIEPGLGAVGDPTLLRLVLENLLGNAWKYSARSARTHIEFKRETVDGRPAFVVRDQGAGFDMRSADRLFGLFQRLHSANDFPGTGVGLASVRRIVRRHGGEIWADAEPGRGASFHFTLAN